jgi:hypothetical protein
LEGGHYISLSSGSSMPVGDRGSKVRMVGSLLIRLMNLSGSAPCWPISGKVAEFLTKILQKAVATCGNIYQHSYYLPFFIDANQNLWLPIPISHFFAPGVGDLDLVHLTWTASNFDC